MARDFVITVMSVDRVGIISRLSGAITELGGNIDALSQTVMRGYFTVIVTVRFDQDIDAESVGDAVRHKGSPDELGVLVRERDPRVAGPVLADAERFVLTVTGSDRRGIIHRISSYLASRGINIEDLYATAQGRQFLLIAQLQVPAGLETERIQMDVQELWHDPGTRVTLQHENVFLATSHVDFRHTAPR